VRRPVDDTFAPKGYIREDGRMVNGTDLIQGETPAADNTIGAAA
jgi:hypothetical protein